MVSYSPFEELPEIPRTGSISPLGEGGRLSPGAARTFQSFMTPGATPGAAPSQGPSPMDVVQGRAPLAPNPTHETVLGQINSAQSTLGDINNYLNNRDLKLRQSSRTLLKNKLGDANDYLKSAVKRSGAAVGDDEVESTTAGPISRFLSYVASGQTRLESTKQQLMSLKEKGDQLRPADFLLLQVDLNLAQQCLEYSSVVLSKAMDDVKTMLNIQI